MQNIDLIQIEQYYEEQVELRVGGNKRRKFRR
jgi:hypothetical protein